jgi:hypothetical protein
MSRVKNELLAELEVTFGFELDWLMEILELVFELNFEFGAGFWLLKIEDLGFSWFFAI